MATKKSKSDLAKHNIGENDSESDEGKLPGDDRDGKESGRSGVSQRVEDSHVRTLSDLESEEMLDGLMQKALTAERDIEASLSMSKLSKEKQEEIRSSLRDLFKVCWEQQVLISHLMGRVSAVEAKSDKPTYAQILDKP
ncbi:hypothetical protein AVEN_259291-1 [Araneus ventricosus]|uniref:Uncharacterized protein n=1 Tax=Araneus ventricosus TaxID=182803 RepID=A0A4Y2GLD6_ARAVE|nr:hypothetical protein AVEN_259291-1 [Araneus ventricosus]